MVIKICTTTEWTEQDWATYTVGFNEVFKKEYPPSFFQKKYINVKDRNSYHALLEDEKEGVVGGCTILPCQYERNGEIFLIGLAVDVFIRESYRSDPLMLRRMYKQLKSILIEKGVVAVVAVPNATAYPYWKNVVKWKDIGTINYWMLPVRIGNILNKWSFLNCISLLYTYTVTSFSVLTSICNASTSNYTYRILPEDEFLQHRYEGDYTIYKDNIYFYVFRIMNEKGIKTAYILDATKYGMRSSKALLKAVRHILQSKVDLVLYVGKMGCFQTLFFKAPKKVEPKLLPLTCDLMSDEDKYTDIYQMDEWDFGLKNYDVR